MIFRLRQMRIRDPNGSISEPTQPRGLYISNCIWANNILFFHSRTAGKEKTSCSGQICYPLRVLEHDLLFREITGTEWSYILTNQVIKPDYNYAFRPTTNEDPEGLSRSTRVSFWFRKDMEGFLRNPTWVSAHNLVPEYGARKNKWVNRREGELYRRGLVYLGITFFLLRI